MLETANLVGAVTALGIYLSSILTFTARLMGKPEAGKRWGYILLGCTLPLIYLLVTAQQLQRPWLYVLQISLMLGWIGLEAGLDYIGQVNFRQNRGAVIVYVSLYFAALGGMIGVASTAGPVWRAVSVTLFLVTAVLAFIQRARTGL